MKQCKSLEKGTKFDRLLDARIACQRLLHHCLVSRYWMRIQEFEQYSPRVLKAEKFPKRRDAESELPKIFGVTPTYQQGDYLEAALSSVLDQAYHNLDYVVIDGGSTDGTSEILAKYSHRLFHFTSEPDAGQGDAIQKGFRLLLEDRSDALMFWLNSDDMLLPESLFFMAEYFQNNPSVDVAYGHRIVIDEAGREIGRWVLPRHHRKVLQWVDYIPQETLFWRRKAWESVGGVDPALKFALDWDLLLRFQEEGLEIRRVPYFLGCFRYHRGQKTRLHMKAVLEEAHDPAGEEFQLMRERSNRPPLDLKWITYFGLRTKVRGALYSRLLQVGIRL